MRDTQIGGSFRHVALSLISCMTVCACSVVASPCLASPVAETHSKAISVRSVIDIGFACYICLDVVAELLRKKKKKTRIRYAYRAVHSETLLYIERYYCLFCSNGRSAWSAWAFSPKVFLLLWAQKAIYARGFSFFFFNKVFVRIGLDVIQDDPCATP